MYVRKKICWLTLVEWVGSYLTVPYPEKAPSIFKVVGLLTLSEPSVTYNDDRKLLPFQHRML